MATELQKAFDHFNERLFGGSLPPCLMTLQRKDRTCGYFSYQRFMDSRQQSNFTDEIALNPELFAMTGIVDTLQTVVHEMVHLWQYHFGKPGRRRYHNKEWADKMESIGLMPSDTGQFGGRRVGERMSDYPIEGGAFLKAAEELLTEDFQLSWHDRYGTSHIRLGATPSALASSGSASSLLLVKSQPTRVKYTCSESGNSVWGKSGLELIDATTGTPFLAEP